MKNNNIKIDNQIAIFRGKQIRKTIYNNEWWFVIVDVVFALTDSAQPEGYIKDMRRRDSELSKGWGQIATPLLIQTFGGPQKMNCANTEGIFRIIQSIPSPKAEPFKLWLARVGYERVEETEKAGKNANFNQREKIAVVDGELGIFRVMEKNQPEKNQQNYAHDNVENKIVHNNLFLLSHGDQNNQADGNGQKSAEDVDVNHSIVNHNYSLDNNKPNDQKISARVKPESIIDQLNFSEKSGSIKTEAKNTWPISRQISDKVSNLNKVNFINSNNYSNSNHGLSNFLAIINKKVSLKYA